MIQQVLPIEPWGTEPKPRPHHPRPSICPGPDMQLTLPLTLKKSGSHRGMAMLYCQRQEEWLELAWRFLRRGIQAVVCEPGPGITLSRYYCKYQYRIYQGTKVLSLVASL